MRDHLTSCLALSGSDGLVVGRMSYAELPCAPLTTVDDFGYTVVRSMLLKAKALTLV